MFKRLCYAWISFFRPFTRPSGYVPTLIALYVWMTVYGVAEQERQLVLGAILTLVRPHEGR